MKTYLNVLLRNNIDINIIFRTELIFFSTKNCFKTELPTPPGSFYIFILSNALIRYFVKHFSLLSILSLQILFYLRNNSFGTKEKINGAFIRSLFFEHGAFWKINPELKLLQLKHDQKGYTLYVRFTMI